MNLAITVLSVTVGLLSVFVAWKTMSYRRSQGKRQDLHDQICTVVDLKINSYVISTQDWRSGIEKEIAELKTFWKIYEGQLANWSHQDNTPEMDIYFERINSGTITLEERKTLRDLLCDKVADESIPAYRRAIYEHIRAIQDARIEMAEISGGTNGKHH